MINNKKSSKAVVIAVAGVALCLLAVVSFGVFQSVQANDVVRQKRNGNICREIPIKVNTIAHEEKDIYTDQYQKMRMELIQQLFIIMQRQVLHRMSFAHWNRRVPLHFVILWCQREMKNW